MYEISARISGLWDNYAHKLLCILKITTIILLVSIAPLQASNVFGQRINYVQKQVSLEQLFKEIKKQTYYNVVWFDDNLNTKATLDVDFKNATIEEVMDRITSNQSASYQIKNNTIIIKWKAPSTGEKLKKTILNFFEALIDVSGRVVDERGDPLPGAKVRVNGPKPITTSTNASGDFTLKGIADNATITISFIGYESKELSVAANMGDIKLAQSDAKLEEVEINAGYYTVKDKERTGSIARVTSETIAKQPVSNVLGALIGRMPGVQITQQTGVPGGGFDLVIRGRNSLRNSGSNNGNLPFFVIDGVPFTSSTLGSGMGSTITGSINPLNSINPNDIESVEVLKDADATAIYGSRGANGVVLITTKKGKSGQTTVNFDLYSGIGKVARKIALLNTEQYLEMRSEAFKNDQASPKITDYDINGTWDKNRYTDWQKILIGGTMHKTSINSSISGGNANTQFLLGGAYYRETTVYPADFAYLKGSGHFNLVHSSINQKFKISFTTSYGIDENNLSADDITTQALTLPPNAPALYDDYGHLNWQNSTWINPIAQLRNTYGNNTTNLIANTILTYQFFPELGLRVNAGYNLLQLEEQGASPIAASDPATPVTGIAKWANGRTNNWIVEPQVEYHKNIGDNRLNIVLGSTFQQNKQDSEYIAGLGYTSDALLNNIKSAPSVTVLSSNALQYRYTALFARVNYILNDKYILNLTGRRDGSSRFGNGKQFGNFGAIGSAWVFSKEGFIDKMPFLSFGKLRMSYGITGNDQIPDYGYLNTYTSVAAYQGGTSLIPSRLANPDYAWEINRKFEAAIELAFLKDALSFEGGWYRNRSSNQLVGYALPAVTGFTTIQYNLPATVQNAGWELSLNAKILQKSNLKWSSSANISIPENKLIAYPNISTSAYANDYEVGKSLFQTKMFNYIGVNPQTGVYQFIDRDGDGIGTGTADRSAIKKLGQDFYGGLQNTLNFKGWQLDVFFQFVKQTGRNYMYSAAFSNAPGFMSNQPAVVMNRWQQPNDQASIQRFTQSFPSAARIAYLDSRNYGDNIITNASFIRLQNIYLSYQLPESWVNTLNIVSCKFFMQGQNLLTITNYLGLDPENQNASTLPPLSVLTAGFKFTL